MAEDVDVVVVGAGLAGLVATAELERRGARVVCLEARERVGGRARSEAGWIDLGATWFWDGQPAMAETVESLGLSTYPQVLAGDALVEQSAGEAVRLDGNPIDRPARRLCGGMQSVPLALAGRLAPGTVRTGLAVRSVEFAAGALVATEAAAFTAAVVVLAVPPALAVESIAFTPGLPPALGQAARAVHTWMSDTVKLVARFAEPFWRDAGFAGAALSHVGPFCELHDHSGPDAGQAALFGFAPAARLGGAPPAEAAARFREQLVRLWGPAVPELAGVHVADWSRDPFTAPARPARPSTHWYYGTPVLRLPQLGGRLVFGSTETASAFPGYLEGAVLAGRRAAGQALELLA